VIQVPTGSRKKSRNFRPDTVSELHGKAALHEKRAREVSTNEALVLESQARTIIRKPGGKQALA
jgi:hypothetical protein